MTRDEQKMLADIERDEQWLRRCAPPAPGPASVEHVKLLTRIAVGEEWLKGFATPAASAACRERARQATRLELARACGVPSLAHDRQRRTSVWSAAPSMAAAAVVVIGCLLAFQSPAGSSGGALDDMIAVVAEQDAEKAADTTALIDALEDAEADWAGAFRADAYSTPLDAIDSQIGDLRERLNSSSDVWEYPA